MKKCKYGLASVFVSKEGVATWWVVGEGWRVQHDDLHFHTSMNMVKATLQDAASLSNMSQLCQKELAFANCVCKDHSMVQILTDALDSFKTPEDDPIVGPASGRSSPRPVARRYSVASMGMENEVDVKTINVEELNVALNKVEKYGSGFSLNARSLLQSVHQVWHLLGHQARSS